MRLLHVLVCVSTIMLLVVNPALSLIDPFSIGAIVAAGISFKYFDKIKLNTYCKLNECCNLDVIPHNIISLQFKLKSKLFGQHIAAEKVFRAIASHFEKLEGSKKPLVMTFHGTQGSLSH